MNWIDEGYLISKNNYNETSIIADIFTKEHGKCSGIIFGGTSKKIRNYLQIGNKFHLNYNYKMMYHLELYVLNYYFLYQNYQKLKKINQYLQK